MSGVIKPLPPGVEPLGVGLHDNVPAERYHADPVVTPSLSSSILRTLIGKSIDHAAIEHPRLGGSSKSATPSMGLGSVVHSLLAGESSDLELGTYDSYRSGAAQTWRDSVKASGKTPVLERDLEDARPVVKAIQDRAALGCSNTPFVDYGRSEVTAVWKEDDAYCRARYDRLVVDPAGYADIWDWKTTTDVSPLAISRAVVKYGYHIQAAFYLRGLTALLPKYIGRTSFIFVFVETAAPFAVRRVTLSPSFLAIGARAVSDGIAQWQQVLASKQFTAPNVDTLEIEPPAFLEDDDEITVS